MKTQKVERLPNISKRKERLLAELAFAKKLAKKQNEDWLNLTTRAEAMIVDAEQKGMLTDALVEEVETLLSPMQEACKEYKVICAAHAHIDMNWM